jgi:hypothetical protein
MLNPSYTIRTLLVALLASAAVAGEPDSPRVRPGSGYAHWTTCPETGLAVSPNQCPGQGAGRRLLESVSCKELEWMGAAMGGGSPDCLTICTCFRYLKSSDALCDITVCPEDRICREDYRFLGLMGFEQQLVAVIAAPAGERNCWRPKEPPARPRATK